MEADHGGPSRVGLWCRAAPRSGGSGAPSIRGPRSRSRENDPGVAAAVVFDGRSDPRQQPVVARRRQYPLAQTVNLNRASTCRVVVFGSRSIPVGSVLDLAATLSW